MSDPKTPLVDVRHLKEYFKVNINAFQSRDLKAVDDVSFQIRKGETLGLVGHDYKNQFRNSWKKIISFA